MAIATTRRRQPAPVPVLLQLKPALRVFYFDLLIYPLLTYTYDLPNTSRRLADIESGSILKLLIYKEFRDYTILYNLSNFFQSLILPKSYDFYKKNMYIIFYLLYLLYKKMF